MSDIALQRHRIARAIAAGVFVFGACSAIAADLTKLDELKLCSLVRRGNQAAAEELIKRGVYPLSEVAYIIRGELFVGMTEGSAVCALGPADHISITHTSSGKHIQAVYPEGRRIRYVYVDNGKVTAWQE